MVKIEKRRQRVIEINECIFSFNLNITSWFCLTDGQILPQFSSVPNDVSIPLGEDVNMTCEATGPTTPFVRWMDGGVELTGNDDLPLGFSVLTLTDVRMSANYTCEAFSIHGKIKHLVQVFVKGELTMFNDAVNICYQTLCHLVILKKL